MIHQAGAKLFYLPSYSPDLNSTEKLWAKVKAFLRKRRALTPEALQRRDRLRLPVLHLLIAETGLHMQSVDEILWDMIIQRKHQLHYLEESRFFIPRCGNLSI